MYKIICKIHMQQKYFLFKVTGHPASDSEASAFFLVGGVGSPRLPNSKVWTQHPTEERAPALPSAGSMNR